MTDYVVTGSNTAVLNGTYIYAGLDGYGNPYYTKDATYVIYMDFMMGPTYWCINEMYWFGAPYFYSFHYKENTITGDYVDNGGGGTANVAESAPPIEATGPFPTHFNP